MKIAVVGGTGYVGLTTAVCLASRGHLVYCVGRTLEKVEKIGRGVPIIFEEGLEELLTHVLKEDKLIATTNLEEAVKGSEVFFVCVGTPSRKDGGIDLTQVKIVSEYIGRALTGKEDYCVVTMKSTVVPGTTEEVVIPLLEKWSGKKAGLDFGVCMNPEFLREGRAVRDFLYPRDQGIVIGELDRRSGDALFEIYREVDAEIMRTNLRTAEMIKYARNSYLAKDVSFANEMANICQKIGVDYLKVKGGMEMDVRIGKERFLNAGVGFGGSCFPKDVRALVAKAKEVGVKPRMLEAALKVNDVQPIKIVELLKKVIGELEGKRVAVLGLAFKPGTDDMREAPSIRIIKALLSEGSMIYAYDPRSLDQARKLFGNEIVYAEKAEEALINVDACIILTEWPEFKDPRLYTPLQGKVIIDGRRALNPRVLPSGLFYYAIGFPEAGRSD